jgi:2-dehydro-3-deoxyphosphogluconate aldolase/(4S)-4-hydroxy-2-oxoglutarate aldolase
MSKNDKNANLKRITDCGVMVVIRAQDSSQLIKVAEAVKKGGIDIFEITMTTPNALTVIKEISDKFGNDLLIGTGTVLDQETARAAILAGAEFIVAPTLNIQVIKLCQRYDKIIVPGAFTPTEILTAWEEGADIVKVFPATAVGPKYFKDIKGPLPQVKLLPTGGVNLDNAGDFIKAGAEAIAVGGNLAGKKLIAEGNFKAITENAKKFKEAVKKARTS